MPFGQLIVGPPGSGKSTYCNGMQQFLTGIGRKVAVVNLDPANDTLPYDCTVDLMDLICLEEVMKEYKLGPNGGNCKCPRQSNIERDVSLHRHASAVACPQV